MLIGITRHIGRAYLCGLVAAVLPCDELFTAVEKVRCVFAAVSVGFRTARSDGCTGTSRATFCGDARIVVDRAVGRHLVATFAVHREFASRTLRNKVGIALGGLGHDARCATIRGRLAAGFGSAQVDAEYDGLPTIWSTPRLHTSRTFPLQR